MIGRVLGLDPGERRIGVAVSDPTGTIASPHSYVDTGPNAVDSIRSLCTELDVTTIVVGLPLRLDGGEGPAARHSRKLGGALTEALGIPVEFWDERFTTMTAENAMLQGNVRRKKRKEKRDQIAAAVMLQGYLDRQAHNDRDPDEWRDG